MLIIIIIIASLSIKNYLSLHMLCQGVFFICSFSQSELLFDILYIVPKYMYTTPDISFQIAVVFLHFLINSNTKKKRAKTCFFCSIYSSKLERCDFYRFSININYSLFHVSVTRTQMNSNQFIINKFNESRVSE